MAENCQLSAGRKRANFYGGQAAPSENEIQARPKTEGELDQNQ